MLDVYFDFPDQNWAFFFTVIVIVITVTVIVIVIFYSALYQLCINSLGQNRACFDCASAVYRLSSAYLSTVLDLCFDFLE